MAASTPVVGVGDSRAPVVVVVAAIRQQEVAATRQLVEAAHRTLAHVVALAPAVGGLAVLVVVSVVESVAVGAPVGPSRMSRISTILHPTSLQGLIHEL